MPRPGGPRVQRRKAATPQRCGRRSRRSYSGRGSRARARVWGRGHDVQADDVIQVLAAERGWDRPVMEGEDGRHRFASSGSKTSRRALASGRSPSTVAAACALTWAMSRVVASASHRAARRAQTMPPPAGSGQVESGAADDRPQPAASQSMRPPRARACSSASRKEHAGASPCTKPASDRAGLSGQVQIDRYLRGRLPGDVMATASGGTYRGPFSRNRRSASTRTEAPPMTVSMEAVDR